MAERLVRCSCTEAEHLRAALTMIQDIATREKWEGSVDDLDAIADLAKEGLELKPLRTFGDTSLNDV